MAEPSPKRALGAEQSEKGRVASDTPPATVRTSWWTAVQVVLMGAVLVFIARALSRQRDELAQAARELTVYWPAALLATLIVLCTYAALIQSWRLLMRGWGSELPFGAAVRIWTTANLGRYLPGKVWSVGAMVVLAQRSGVNPVAATGAAVLGTLINIGAGFGVVALCGMEVVTALDPRFEFVTWVASAGFGIGVLVLPRLLPPVLAWLSRRRASLVLPERPLAARTIWLAVAINVLSWAGYGVAFRLLSESIFPAIGGAVPGFIAIWTASYLVGYLTLFAPGGIGAREGALILALGALGVLGSADAALLAIFSRLWLTVLEVVPGLISVALSPTRSFRR